MSILLLEQKNLPKGWSLSSLDNFTILIQGQSPPSSTYNDKGEGLPFFQGKAEFNELYPTIKKWCTVPRKIAEKDDILLCVRAGTGAINLNPTRSCIGRGLSAIRTMCDVDPFYVVYFLQTLTDFFNGQGTTITGITSNDLKNLQIPIAPFNEQKRIVNKIKVLFSELDNIKSTLNNVKIELDEFEQTLLKFAFEGKLTKKWRECNNPTLNNIFKKIDEEKKNQDKKLQNIEPNTIGFFQIPDNWNWIKIANVSKEIQYGTSEKATTTKSKIPVLRMGNIQDGKLDFNKLKYYPNNWEHFKTFELKDGDVLFNRTNSAELVGKTAVYYNHHPSAVFAGYLIRVKLLENTFLPSLLSYYINSIFGKLYVSSVVTQQVGQANVNSTKLMMMPLPLMSFEEQKEIHSQLELYLSLIKNTENVVNSLLTKLETLYSTILKKAFEGKLVPQDPNDEPAEILLQKIKQEKEQLIQKQKPSKRKKNVK
ncbi:restriction endonuclease subunit S [Nitrosopumilus sp. S4]